ncbi:YicC family protein [Temperatibacter marinus]|uniref:YicC family protein n=1 Tax=Temperatibacter marinus TaxID=1456591 RepID=A0AA52H9C2_9PROT|nr:YicC/YloC family endoribonuclease [Temperatibacter marinus]WND02347.1 YicC family protein [Temperatibacter marinus]
MSLKSMTGFARHKGLNDSASWYWEIKTVNAKGLDIRTRIPSFLEGLEHEVKKMVGQSLTRGSVFVSLSIEMEQMNERLQINEERLSQVIEISKKYSEIEGVSPASLDGLLGLKGVLELKTSERSEEDNKQLLEELKESLSENLVRLNEARLDEGARMQAVLSKQLDEVEHLVKQAVVVSGDRLDAMKHRFQSQLEKVYEGSESLSEERLAQEIATIAVKADIQEEIDRLNSHIEDARILLQEEKAVGRRLDFLTQEFNREANTLCSKSGDTKLTRIGIDLKTVIDQFREQIQNIQ